jgi:integrase/recombinase XerD
MHQTVHEGRIMAVQLLDHGNPTPLERLVDDYLSNCAARGLSPRTDEQYSYSLNDVFLPWCHREDITRLEQLDRRAFDRFTASLLARRNRYGNPISRHSVHTFIRPVRLLLNWASREGEDVVARPQLPRREKPLRDVLTRREIDQLENAMPYERDKLIIRLFGDCGLRLDELASLDANTVIRSARQAHLRVLGKRSRVRDVPIPPSLLRRLDRFIGSRPAERDSDALFLSHRLRNGEYSRLTNMGVYQVVKDAVRRARLEKTVYPHLLRHSWMTEMLRSGMNPIQLSMIAGASPEVIGAHYAHLNKDDAYDAMIHALGASRR